MITDQLSINTSVVVDEAHRLEQAGYPGDAVAFVERLLLRAFSSGYRPLDPPIPRRGPGASRAAVEAARAVVEEALRAAKDKRVTKAEETA